MDIGEFREDDIGFSICRNNIAEDRIGHAIHRCQPNNWLREGLPEGWNGLLMGGVHERCDYTPVLEF